jgi:hypothetical protein
VKMPALVLLPLLAIGCTHSVHQVSVATAADIPPGARLRHVEAKAEQHVVLYITDNTDFADEAYRALVAQCPRGEVVGIEARNSTSHGFLSFDNEFKLSGWCLEPEAGARARR